MIIKPITRKKNGFALIATILLMVLLAIITVGTLSLSAVTLRNTGNDSAQNLARANARMALMIAIGELQRHTGPDTRITAPSNIIDPDSPPLIGAWKSWEGTNHDSTGRPILPDYNSKLLDETDGGRFLGWLISGTQSGATPADKMANLAFSQPQASGSVSTVPLISTGTLADNSSQQVHVYPDRVNETGAIAWWVSGENQKARLPLPHGPAARPYGPHNDNAAGWSDFAKSHSVIDPKTFGLENLLTDPSNPATKVFSRGTTDFIAAPNAAITPREYFHDLSINSVGLLTNTATGGWKKDMSLMTELWPGLPGTGLPLFRISPDGGAVSSVTKPTAGVSGNALTQQSLIYPWLDYGLLGQSPISTQYTNQASGAVSSWENLVNYATAYRTKITASTNGTGTMPYSWTMMDNSGANPQVTNQHRYDYLHTQRTAPVISRIQWVFSHRASLNNGGTPANPADDTYPLQLLLTPVVTLWNPYNVTITSPSNGLRIRVAKPPPCALVYYNRDGTTAMPGRKLHLGSNSGNVGGFVSNYPNNLYSNAATSFEYNFANLPPLLPGETKVFSPSGAPTAAMTVNMALGYNATGGFIRNIDFLGPAHRSTDLVKLDVKFDNLMNFQTTTDCGIFLDLLQTNNPNLVYQRYLMRIPQATARQYWPDLTSDNLPSPPAADILNTWRPFFSMVFGARLSSNSSTPTKGLLQNSPLTSLTQTHNAVSPSRHPVNNAFDFSFFPHSLGGDDRTPNANSTNNRGYIVSGFQASSGLSRVILNEFPLRPMASLAELQNWDLRSHNPYPPFQINIIGNSDASPLIASNAVFRMTAAYDNVMLDDAYCANHLLFDDWFLSSIAPEPQNFAGSTMTRNIGKVYEDFLNGTKPLVNRAYRPIIEDSGLGSTEVTERVNQILNSTDGWQKVASRLEVEGMFNVNSTSLNAWRALLRHAKNQKIPYYEESGATLSAETQNAFSRFAVSGDKQAGEVGSMSGAFPEASEFTGYRVFTDEMLDILAEKIVEQVKTRGPFLSLSEFINRRLDTATDERALAGAIQTALNQLAAEPGNNIHGIMEGLTQATQTDPIGNEGYQFRQAAAGHSSYGLPGWIRQADVLRPIAPILSARDDTFTIRAYGDARDKNGKVLAKAWCEATVHRTRDFVDPTDPADSIDAPTSNTNIRFGRRYVIRSFRWLSPNEV